MSTQAAAIIYSFDTATGLAASGDTSGLTLSAISATHGSNSDASGDRQMAQGWYSRDTGDDGVFFISARSFDNKGIAPENLDMTNGRPSYISFTMDAGAGNTLNLSSSSISFDATAYADSTFSQVIAYSVWANTGDGWTMLDAIDSVTGDATGASSTSVMYEDAAKTTSITGWALTSNVLDTSKMMSFDISSLGDANQSVEFAVAISGTRDNHGNWGASIDNLALTDFAPIPEPSSSALLGLAGMALLFRRKL